MSEDDDGPSRSHRHGDEGGESKAFPDVQQPNATWTTLETTLSVDEARARLVAGLTRFRAPYELRETRAGFIVHSPGSRPVMAELAFATWEEGTQIHISLPKAGRDRDKHLAALREFVKNSLEWGSRQA